MHTEGDKQPSVPEKPYPTPFCAWWTVLILMIAYTLSFIDRQILSLLVEPIRKDIVITDTQMSLVQGFAFALFYAIFGIPMGVLADRKNRRNIVAVGVVFWSFATALIGSVSTFVQLFIARLMVGVGEATLSPAAYSIISDSFSPVGRGRAMSTYTVGAYIGSGLALIIGGSVIGYTESWSDSLKAMGFVIEPWKLAMLTVSMPGIVVALLIFTITEPTRKEKIEEDYVQAEDSCPYIRELVHICGPIIFALSLISIVFYSTMSWLPTHYIRKFGLSASEVGKSFGIIILVFAPLGMWTAGTLSDWLAVRKSRNGSLVIVTLGTLAATILAVTAPLVTNFQISLIISAGLIFFISFPSALGPVILQGITKNDYRGTVTSIYILTVTLVGLGIGPTAVAATSDYFVAERSIGVALAMISLVSGTLSTLTLIYICNGVFMRNPQLFHE